VLWDVRRTDEDTRVLAGLKALASLDPAARGQGALTPSARAPSEAGCRRTPGFVVSRVPVRGPFLAPPGADVTFDVGLR